MSIFISPIHGEFLPINNKNRFRYFVLSYTFFGLSAVSYLRVVELERWDDGRIVRRFEKHLSIVLLFFVGEASGHLF